MANQIELTYCVVNTSQRELLAARAGRDRARARGPSRSRRRCWSWTTARATAPRRPLARTRRSMRRSPCRSAAGKGLNDSELLRRARGRYALLLNEDSELRAGATLALHRALAGAARRGLRRGQAAAPRRGRSGLGVALPDASHCARRRAVPAAPVHRPEPRLAHAGGGLVPVRGAARPARGRREQVDYLDPDFFVYSDEVDFARRLRDAGWRSLYVPAAVAVHHEQLSTGTVPERRDRRTGAQPRPVHAQAPLAARGSRPCAG